MCQGDGFVCIFGFGSLMWRPGFHFERKFTGYVKGYIRRFWQSCQYHRGTPKSPGRVVTLVEAPSQNDIVYGVCYVIRADIGAKIIEDLDIRETGGYERKFLPIYVETNKGEVVAANAHVYVCMPNNPELVINDDETIAHIIAKSTGNSGPNKDYLFNLCKSLRSLNLSVEDKHAFNLEARVQQLLQEYAHTNQHMDLLHHQHLISKIECVSQKKQLLSQVSVVPKGTVIVDNGAVAAISNRFKPLLPIGVVDVIGDFDRNDIVWVVSHIGQKQIAKAVSNFSSAELMDIKGKHSKYVKALIPGVHHVHVIERDNMILL